jgi:hypothetical protein
MPLSMSPPECTWACSLIHLACLYERYLFVAKELGLWPRPINWDQWASLAAKILGRINLNSLEYVNK